MKTLRRVPSPLLAGVVAAMLFALPAAHADDYADVNRLARSGKPAEALAKADSYLATNPRDPQMRFIKAVIEADTGKTDAAIAIYTQLTQDYPELPEPYNNLAALYASRGEYDRARNALEMAVRTNPRYALAYENLGDVYARLAAESYAKAIALDAATQASAAPKLAVIRSLFPAKAQKPAVMPAATPPGPAAKASAAE
ncbi:MAG: uncharacterized protein OJF60_001703 [Burkholderiaceae bacterium]|jgi:tetratricopeptide (TPR) repeat protein|nr:MAG: uncharacterized protein OJF60_001703 [Burkholderiaceae bacterium]